MEPVTLFDHVDFGGQAVPVGEGSTRFPTPAHFGDRASSIRVAPGYCALLYEHANENGGYGLLVDLLEDCPDLSVYGFDKIVSYIRVFRTEHDNFVWVRGRITSGTFVSGHWERKRADGSNAPVGGVAVVWPSVPPPTEPESHTLYPEVSDHRIREILEIDFQNPQFNRTDDWAKAIGGDIGFPLANYEWTQVLAPDEEYDQFTLVGAAGWMINPHHSHTDFPFSHPFVDSSSDPTPLNLPPVYDWEFDVALDRDYEFLLAEGNRIATSDAEHPRGLLGVEIDGAFVPRGFKTGVKTRDRIAVFGRWIVDTGHKKENTTFRSEIHPPLLMACASVQTLANGQRGTRVLFTTRPYLVGQRFTLHTDQISDDSAGDDGALLEHFTKEYAKIHTGLSFQVSAHPKIKSHPFRGVHLLRIKVRPPALEGPRIPGAMEPRLAVSFQFTVRSGCAVQLASLSGDDTVDVLISLSHAGYKPPPLPRRHSKKWSRDEFHAMSKGIGQDILIEAGAAGPVLTHLLGVIPGLGLAHALIAQVILEQGIESDLYDLLPGVDINDAQHAVRNAWANQVPHDAGIVRNDDQPFPIFGWLEATWQSQVITPPPVGPTG